MSDDGSPFVRLTVEIQASDGTSHKYAWASLMPAGFPHILRNVDQAILGASTVVGTAAANLFITHYKEDS